MKKLDSCLCPACERPVTERIIIHTCSKCGEVAYARCGNCDPWTLSLCLECWLVSNRKQDFIRIHSYYQRVVDRLRAMKFR